MATEARESKVVTDAKKLAWLKAKIENRKAGQAAANRTVQSGE